MITNEIIYLVLDELKLSSDDSIFEPEHIFFLAEKYRAFLLKQRYSDIKKTIPEANYSTICVELEEDSDNTVICNSRSLLKSKKKIPFIMNVGNTQVYPMNYYTGDIAYISRDRMKYVGNNKYLRNIIYCSLSPDSHLYFISSNPQFLYLERVRVTAIFASLSELANLQCGDENKDTICDIFDMEFPMEAALVPPLIELIVKELSGPVYTPKDDNNDASDELSDIRTKR